VKGQGAAEESARDVLRGFVRWPTWMRANEEVADFTEWLRDHNRSRTEADRVGLYGLDVYSLWESLSAVMEYLYHHDPGALRDAWRAMQCFERYGEDARDYARARAIVDRSCEGEVVSLLRKLRERSPSPGQGTEDEFSAGQNALVLKNAEAYYRTMVRGGPEAWNVRDRHMAETLDRLIEHHGPRARAIVWAHNSHIGDARHTDMAEQGEVNLGELVREGHSGEGVVLVGFGSYEGTVIAGKRWDAPMERMDVPPARDGSWEDVLHRAGEADKLLLFSPTVSSRRWLEPCGHRAIGVVYRPEYEHHGNYVPTVLPRRPPLLRDHTGPPAASRCSIPRAGRGAGDLPLGRVIVPSGGRRREFGGLGLLRHVE
jgi:erythromycin esterase-like protein